ncbi:hypothetical protein [Sulfuricurvum sp.]|uniref:hypothetical protein n=1 Tax=Sulfuricurvum sp. TaxID=2025608 RepID=UPI003BB54662
MQSLTINFQDDQLFTKVLWLLEHFKKDGLEVVSKDDIEDLKALSKTRNEESIPFEEYLKNAH